MSKVMRAYTGIGWLLNLAASLLTLNTYLYVHPPGVSRPLRVPAGADPIYVTYVLVGGVLSFMYFDNGRIILIKAVLSIAMATLGGLKPP
jgi:hypothetical protein